MVEITLRRVWILAFHWGSCLVIYIEMGLVETTLMRIETCAIYTYEIAS